jgi:hypothetical protein
VFLVPGDDERKALGSKSTGLAPVKRPQGPPQNWGRIHKSHNYTWKHAIPNLNSILLQGMGKSQAGLD